MSGTGLHKLLADNGFTCYILGDRIYNIKNLRIYETEQRIHTVNIVQWDEPYFTIYIHFKGGSIDIPHVDVSEYEKVRDIDMIWCNFLYRSFTNKNALLDELYKLNSYNINIKG